MVPFVGPTSILPAPLLVQPVKNEPDHFWQAEFTQSGPISVQWTLWKQWKQNTETETRKVQPSYKGHVHV